LAYLQADTAERYKRTQVEKLFSVSASAAAELMKVAGATTLKPAGDLTVSRSNLLHYLKYSPEAQDALQEVERRKKLAARLQHAEADLKLRNVRLRVTKDDEWSRFADLPNVSVSPGLLQVAFTPGDPVDVLDTLFRFLKACGNEWEEFTKMCAPAVAAEAPAVGALPVAETEQG
jgi:hypothetical protein